MALFDWMNFIQEEVKWFIFREVCVFMAPVRDIRRSQALLLLLCFIATLQVFNRHGGETNSGEIRKGGQGEEQGNLVIKIILL